MKRLRTVTAGLAAALLATAVLQASQFVGPTRQGHFFLPPRTLFFFRPDLYLLPLFRLHPLYPAPHCSVASPLPPVSSYRVYRMMIAAPGGEIVQANTADLIFQVHPAKALIYIDDRLIGSAADFSTERDRYSLLEGEHTLRIEFPGYQPFQTRMEVAPNRTLHLEIELEAATRP